MKHIKMYKVTFNHYGSDEHVVSSARLNEYNEFVDEKGEKLSAHAKDYSYIYPPSPFLIREDEIEKYKKYGCEYKSLEYVGSIMEI